MTRLEELKAEAEAAQAESAASALTPEETEEAGWLAKSAAAREDKAANDRTRRMLDGKAREKIAVAAAAGKYLVRAVDIIDLFPVDVKAPDPKTLPGNGVIIVRSPPTQPRDMLGDFFREIEHKQRSMPEIYADLVVASTVDPDVAKDDVKGAVLRAFCEAYSGACIKVGDQVSELGGLRSKSDKRGRK